MDLDITYELAAALENMLTQTYQMQDIFSDEDQNIANAVANAEDVLRRYWKTKARPDNVGKFQWPDSQL